MNVVRLSRHNRTWGRCLLVLALLVGILVAGHIMFSLWKRIHAIDSAQVDHAEWVYTQLEVEYLKLDRAIVRARSGNPGDLADLRQQFDIYYSRTEIAQNAGTTGDAFSDLDRLRDVLDEQVQLVRAGDTRLFDGLDELQNALGQTGDIPRNVALASVSLAVDVAKAERGEIVRLLEILSVVVLVVTVALISAIIRLLVQANTVSRASRDAKEHHLRLATMLRASLDAIVVSDENGSILDFNGSAEDIFGLDRQDVIGGHFIDLLIPPHLQEELNTALEAFRRTGKPQIAESGRRELEMIDSDGRVFPIELSVSLAQSKDGPIFVSYIHDITDRKQKEQEIVQARDDALAAYREKSRFFAMMSHEMRTPLNGVLSALQLLGDGRLDAEQQKYLDAALTSGDILLGHINDVLSIERSEADRSEQQTQSCNMVALTSGVIDSMGPLAQHTGNRLHLDQTGLDDRCILTDPRAVHQVLVHLLSNAINFSPDGDITLRALYRHADDESLLLHFEVSDTDIDVTEADVPHPFEDCIALDSSYERPAGGSGLGLEIVRRLVQGLGGDIRCESRAGQNSRFIVCLPVTLASTSNTPAPSAPQVEEAHGKSLHLLVVDDNQINRELLGAILKRLGHIVSVATGGQEAVDLAKSTRFDAILMDISMPGMNGIQATKAILDGDGPNNQTRIIPVTAHAQPKEREEFEAAGMKGFLQKPLNMEALKSALAAFSSAENAPAENQTLRQQPVLNSAHVTELRELLGQDRLKDRIMMLLQSVDADLPDLTNTQTILDLQTRAHALGGMCGMFGAERFHVLLSEVETACKEGNTREAHELVKLAPAVWHLTREAWLQQIGA